MSNTRKRNEKQKALFDEWVKKEKELQDSFSELSGKTLSSRKAKASHELIEKYKKLIKEAGD
ncbi:MAG: hypothetical protein HFE82_06760 [Erysipelotrichaceae bacterium]|nr:hypothetical protein [Erysipelotrichaceae bacterium]